MDKKMKTVENLEGTINYRLLKAKVSQQILKKLDNNFKSFFESLKDFAKHPGKYKKSPRPPKYLKQKQHDLIYDYQAFQIKDGFIIIEKDLKIALPKCLSGKIIKQIEIKPKFNCFEVVFSYMDEADEVRKDELLEILSEEEWSIYFECFDNIVPADCPVSNFKVPAHKKVKKNKLFEMLSKEEWAIYLECFDNIYPIPDFEVPARILAIDLGLNNLCTCTSNGIITPFVIDGKRLKAINQLYNKRVAAIKSVLDKCQPEQKWSAKLQRITDKRNNQVRDYLHKTSHKIIDICVKNKITEIVVGDVAKSLGGINLGKRNNQNFVNISLGQLVLKLKYKAESHGIKVSVTNESYTSKASFVNNDEMPKQYNPEVKPEFSGKRVQRGLYKSKDGISINADCNGSYNILRKSNPEFTFSRLKEAVKEGIADWLHPKKYFILKI
jgi:putative transposase